MNGWQVTAVWVVVFVGLTGVPALAALGGHLAIPPSLDVRSIGESPAVSHTPQSMMEPLSSASAVSPPTGEDTGLPVLWLGGHIGPIDLPAISNSASPRPMIVNPNALYTAEPAPMGIGDFGVTDSGVASTYYTPAFQATAHIVSYSSVANQNDGNWTSLQLNVVVVMSHGSSLAEYWIQDVPIYNTSSDQFYIENNVWNFSGSPDNLNSQSVQGNGSIYSYGSSEYYADGAGTGYSGVGASLSLPANISARVVASNLSGSTHVGFEYNDGYGWVTYDNVTFPWTKGWTFNGFEVNGSSYNPYGIYDDAEWVIAGPGGGSTLIDLASNVTMSLAEFNGHNFQEVPTAYDFGSDTAESASYVTATLLTTGSPGAPADRLLASSGALKYLYGPNNDSLVNVSAPVLNGTLLVNGVPTPYRGAEANVTLMPGTYRFAVENKTGVVASKNETLTAKEYLALSFAEFSLGPAESRSEASVWANGTGFVADSTVSVTWPGNSTPQCQEKASSSGAFSCEFTVPLVPAGTYNLSASDDASSADVAWSELEVTTNLTVAATDSPSATDLGRPLTFWGNATGGFVPYSTYTWNFGDGTQTQTSVGTTSYTYPKSGTFTMTVTVRDRIGDSISASTDVVIRADPLAGEADANRSGADIGQSVAFTESASYGDAPYTYAWTGLPAGCGSSAGSATCPAVTTEGNYSVVVIVTDSEGDSTSSSPLAFRVSSDPVITSFTNLRPFLDAGQNLSLLVEPTGGFGAYSYSWTGLPTGCLSVVATVLCRLNTPESFTVNVTVSDRNGFAVTSQDLPVTVAPDPSVQLIAPDGVLASDLGQNTDLEARVVGGSGQMGYRWSDLPTGCVSANLSDVPCLPTGTGTFDVGVKITDGSGATAGADANYTVFTTPSVSWIFVSTNIIAADVEHPITLQVASSGGNGPFRYDWVDLPPGCLTADVSLLQCDPSVPGSYSLSVQSIDSNHDTATTPRLPLTVDPSPSIKSLHASSSSVVSGYPLTLTVQVEGGSGAFTYQWFELPVGCNPRNVSQIQCRPTSVGLSLISVVATDSLGESANATIHVRVVSAVLGLPPTQGYAVILVGLLVLVAVLVLVVLWVRRSAKTRASKRPPGSPGGQ